MITTITKTVKTIHDYQECINKVKTTRVPLQVKVILSKKEFCRREELCTDGVKIAVGEDYDEIKPASETQEVVYINQKQARAMG